MATSRRALVAGPGPSGDFAEGVKLVVAGGVGVLHRDLGSELHVVEDGLTERPVGGHIGGIEGGAVELDESPALGLGDLQATMDLDQVGKPDLVGESSRTAEGFSGERGQVVDMLRLTGAEERLKDRVGENAGVEDILEVVDGFPSSRDRSVAAATASRKAALTARC